MGGTRAGGDAPVQGQGVAVLVVLDVVVTFACPVGVGRPVAAAQHIGAAQGEGGGIARQGVSGGKQAAEQKQEQSKNSWFCFRFLFHFHRFF